MARDRIDFDKFRFGEVKNDPDKSGFLERVMNTQIAYCGVNCFPCDDMADFYEESKSHKEAYHRMVSMNADR